jgi:protein-tyrosine phosphatase
VAVVFAIFAALLTVAAARHGGWAWALLWPATSLAIVSVAYAGAGARLLGKRVDGRIAAWAVALHLPFLLLTLAVWHLVVALRGSREASLVAEGLWVGRRPRARDLPAGVVVVADLTSEFAVARGIAGRYEYWSLPTLDGHVPPVDALVAFARRLAAAPGPVYLHCAQGHGRAAVMAACVLVARGAAADADTAIAMVRAARPKVRLTPRQKATLREAAGRIVAERAATSTNGHAGV